MSEDANGLLAPNQFPLYAIGVHVYGRAFSSPLFTAQTPDAATGLALWLNDYAAIKIRAETGPVLVTAPSGTLRL